MDMMDRLSALVSGVDHGAVPSGQAFRARDVARQQQKLSQQTGLALVRRIEGSDVLPRDEKHVHRCLGGDVAESQDTLALVDHVGGNRAVDDLTEEASGVRHPPETNLAPPRARDEWIKSSPPSMEVLQLATHLSDPIR